MKKFYFLLFLFVSGGLFAQTYEYRFNNNLNEQGSGPALVDTLTCGAATSAGYSSQSVCTGGAKTVFDFNAGEGLVFENSSGFLGPSSSYTINMLMKLNTLTSPLGMYGSQRIINFDTTSNFGVYSFPPSLAAPDGGVQFYTGNPLVSNSSNKITANTYFLFTMVRDATTDSVIIYINGHKADSIWETSGLYAPQNSTAPIWFFIDNESPPPYTCEEGAGSISYLSIITSAFSETQVDSTWKAQCPIVLPLQLLQFQGSKHNNAVDLSWTTTQEINTSYFDVERGSDGIHFNKIATLPTNNTPSVNNYYYTDQNPLSTNFYRLKMVDIDGSFKYSSVLKINLDGALKFDVFPNPANSSITVSGISENQIVKLLSSDGKLLLQKRVSGESMTMDISKYSPGLYILQYFDGTSLQSRKIIKQ
ncbi:MAG: T9SS type A sorting domain-containing protein [Chitinophagaceae bacterium]|nr:T9SS type A sorting domain-containing protein [Chitinophagaceae bacterium]